MEKHLFGFLLFSEKGLMRINEILNDRNYQIGEHEVYLLTSIHQWLKEEKTTNTGLTTSLVLEWGLGFRLSALEKLGLKLKWYNNNDKLRMVKIPPHFTIDFRRLEPKRDVVAFCPTIKERKKYFESEERYRFRSRSFPIWHWMSISKKDIMDYDRDDENIDNYLLSQFKTRNYREQTPLTSEGCLF